VLLAALGSMGACVKYWQTMKTGGAMRLLLLTAFVISISMSVAQAASITTTAPVLGGMPRINIDGEIAPGDAQAFAAIAKTMPRAAVFLRSGGGDLDTGIAIGQMVRQHGFWTAVDRRGGCASACALIWLGGVHAVAQRWSVIVFHRPSTPDGAETPEGTKRVVNYMRRLGYGNTEISYVLRAPPSESPMTMEWHARALGIHFQIVPTLLGWGWTNCQAHFCVATP
jgi:hypothetical protein